MLFSWWAATQGAALQIHCLLICAGPNSFLPLSLSHYLTHTLQTLHTIATYICHKENVSQLNNLNETKRFMS